MTALRPADARSNGRRRGSGASVLAWPPRGVPLSATTAGVLVGAITAVGLGLRLPSFGDSLFGDELSTYYVVTNHGLGTVLHLLNGHFIDLNPPLFFVLAWVSVKVFGASTESLKLASLLAGTATIPLAYALGRLTVGVRAGLLASALVTLSPFLIFYSTEARPYALLALTCLLSTLALLQALRTGARGWWAAYAASSCAALYTQYTAVFLLAAQAAWAFVARPNARRPLLVANVATAIAFLPWLPSLIGAAHNPLNRVYGHLEAFNLRDVRLDLGRWSIGHPYVPLDSTPGMIAVVMILVGVGIAVLGAAPRRWRTPHPRALTRVRSEVALAVVLACAAPAGVFLYSAVHESIWVTRNLISSWPGFAVLLASLLLSARAPWRAFVAGLAIAAFAIGGVRMLSTARHRPDYGSAAAYIDRASPDGGAAVEFGQSGPGPPTELEAALALAGSARRHPVVRLGVPPLAAVLRARPGHQLASQPGVAVAREAVALAGHGQLLLVTSMTLPIATLEAIRRLHIRADNSVLGALGAFLGALPARFHPVEARTFPGFTPVTVYVYRQ